MPINAFFRGFNRAFEWVSSRYGALTARLVRVSLIMLVLYAGLIGLTVFQFRTAPTGFIPQQDLGYLINIIQLPPGASLARTDEVARKVTKIVLERRASRMPCRSSASTAPPSPARRTPPWCSRRSTPFKERAEKGQSATSLIARR